LLKIFDKDMLSPPPNAMGVVRIIIPAINDVDTTEWYDVPPDSAKNASGKLQIRIQTSISYSRSLVRGNAFVIFSNQIQIGLAWDMINGHTEVDLDVSCVALSQQGHVVMPDTVYYANTANSNESVIHSGDEKEGDEEGDDERIVMQLDKIPQYIRCMYILLTVATPQMRIPDIKSTVLRVYNDDHLTLCSFTPATHALSRNATAMFMVRIARSSDFINQWILSPIEDTHPTARDFGSLVPYLKNYTRDLLPNIRVDPTERVAILRKGGNVRLTDYCAGGKLPDQVTFGLAWDVTDGVNIDLDASALCLDRNMNLVDKVSWSQLKSDDTSIRHHGDEREGDEIGDDEKMDIYLSRVSRNIQYIGFVINSYSGQELDDVDKASCHLFDSKTNVDMVTYAMTNSQTLDGYTGLLVACLYRGEKPGEWGLSIIGEPGHGKLAKDLMGPLQNYLLEHPPTMPFVEEEYIPLNEMPTYVDLVDEEIDLSAPIGEGEINLSAPYR
jgi:tellurium resistance protein TerZ